MMHFKKYLSSAAHSSALRMGRAVGVAACSMLLLGALWSCSSDDDDNSDSQPQFTHSTYVAAESPDWFVDWSYSSPEPAEWADPEYTLYECSMSMLVQLPQQLLRYSTDQDLMAIFVNGTCRGVSNRNVYSNGDVLFLINIRGASEDAGQQMELRYYSGGAQQLFVDPSVPTFTPNNIVDEAFSILLDPTVCSTKYPYFSEFYAVLPAVLPFTISDEDKLAVFVGEECRGVLNYGGDGYEGWRGEVMLRQVGEQGYMRYYSATTGGIYTLTDSFTLKDGMQSETVTF